MTKRAPVACCSCATAAARLREPRARSSGSSRCGRLSHLVSSRIADSTKRGPRQRRTPGKSSGAGRPIRTISRQEHNTADVGGRGPVRRAEIAQTKQEIDQKSGRNSSATYPVAGSAFRQLQGRKKSPSNPIKTSGEITPACSPRKAKRNVGMERHAHCPTRRDGATSRSWASDVAGSR